MALSRNSSLFDSPVLLAFYASAAIAVDKAAIVFCDKFVRSRNLGYSEEAEDDDCEKMDPPMVTLNDTLVASEMRGKG